MAESEVLCDECGAALEQPPEEGDAEFQRKCLGKMSDVAQEGRTVLFVSHNMSAILQHSPTLWTSNNTSMRNSPNLTAN